MSAQVGSVERKSHVATLRTKTTAGGVGNAMGALLAKESSHALNGSTGALNCSPLPLKSGPLALVAKISSSRALAVEISPPRSGDLPFRISSGLHSIRVERKLTDSGGRLSSSVAVLLSDVAAA